MVPTNEGSGVVKNKPNKKGQKKVKGRNNRISRDRKKDSNPQRIVNKKLCKRTIEKGSTYPIHCTVVRCTVGNLNAAVVDGHQNRKISFMSRRTHTQ